MKNAVKEKMARGGQTIGTFLDSGSAMAAECMGLAGLDYLIVDTEHSPFGLAEVTECCRAAQLRGIAPFVRVGEVSRTAVMKALDVGAAGLIVPGIQTVDEVKKLVEYGKYTPLGSRGFCPTRCCAFGYGGSFAGGIGAYTEECNREALLIPQCETLGCLAHLEEIVALPGVDGIFVGPYDLSVALQKPGQFEDETFTAALSHILAVCKKNAVPVWIFAPTLKAAALRLAQGYDSVCFGVDLSVLTDAYAAALHTLNAARAAEQR